MPKLKQKVQFGGTLSIDLSDRTHAFAHVIESPNVVFYDWKTANTQNYSDVSQQPVGFIITDGEQDLKSGRWPKIGDTAIAKIHATAPVTFGQDPMSGHRSFRHISFENWQRPTALS